MNEKINLKAIARKQMFEEEKLAKLEAMGIKDIHDVLDRGAVIIAFELHEVDLEKIYNMPYKWYRALLDEYARRRKAEDEIAKKIKGRRLNR